MRKTNKGRKVALVAGLALVRPLYYECADCGHAHETNWREGGSTL